MDAADFIPSDLTPGDPGAGDYVRQARRIRAIHRGNPAKTQQALKNLIAVRLPAQELMEIRPDRGSQSQQRGKIDWTTSAVLGHRAPAARLFADQVAERLLGKMLPYSARLELIQIAEAQGINRFEANLIIATVQNRMGAMELEEIAPRTKRRVSFPLMALVAAEVAVVAMLWRIFL